MPTILSFDDVPELKQSAALRPQERRSLSGRQALYATAAQQPLRPLGRRHRLSFVREFPS
jgi:hypothetical protein